MCSLPNVAELVTYRITPPNGFELSGGWVGMDSAWEQDSAEAWKRLVNHTESQPSAARFVNPYFVLQ